MGGETKQTYYFFLQLNRHNVTRKEIPFYYNNELHVSAWYSKVTFRINHYMSPWIYFYSGLAWFGIATDYGLDGPGSNPGGDEIFRSSRPALGPTQPPVKWVPCLSRG